MDQPAAIKNRAKFRISEVLSKSVGLFFRRPFTYLLWIWGPTFVGMSLLGLFMAALIDQVAVRDFSGPEQPTRILVAVLPLITVAAISSVSCAAAVQIAWRDIRQLPVRAVADAWAGMARVPALFFLTLLAGTATFIGTALYLIPGLFLISMWAAAGAACVVERLGPVRSLGRSRRLTKGARWRVLGLVLTVGVINMGVTFLAVAIGQVFRMTPELAAIPITIWVLAQLAMYPFVSICFLAAYHDMRVAKEGVDIERLASVFD